MIISYYNRAKKSVSIHDMRNLIFGDFMGLEDGTSKIYCEVKDMAELNIRMEEYLSEYNQQSRKPMDLVMFGFAIEHISRISRQIDNEIHHFAFVNFVFS